MNTPQKSQDERGNIFLHLSEMNGNGYHQIGRDLMKLTLVNQNQELVPRPGEAKLAKNYLENPRNNVQEAVDIDQHPTRAQKMSNLTNQ